MPICWDPLLTAPDGDIYKAYGGLRLKKFIDAYGANGRTFSICNSDFSNPLSQIGNAITQALTANACVDYPLIDTDPNTAYTEPQCQAHLSSPCTRPGVGDCLPSGFAEKLIPECKDSQGNILDPVSLDPSLHSQAQIDAVLAAVSDSSRPCWYLAYDNGVPGCKGVSFNSQRISALLPTGTVAPPDTYLSMQCLTCASADGRCPPLGRL
jgi:hypothetical protein